MNIRMIGILLFSSVLFTACDNYQDKMACEKEDIIWENIVSSEYDDLPNWTGEEGLSLLSRIALDPLGILGLARQFLEVTVFRDEDNVENRTRVIHSYGAVAKIKFEAASGQPFTGLYQGVPCGLVRLSIAGPANDIGIAPGMGVKFLIDGEPSANFVAMFSLDGQTGYNFFKHNFSNVIELPDNSFIEFGVELFKLVSDDPTRVDVSFMAEIDAVGSTLTVAEVDAPWVLVLKPNSELAFANEAHDFRDDLHTIAEGSLLYKVYATRRGQDQEIYVGDMVTKSKFISSAYGDKELFFRHERIDDHL